MVSELFKHDEWLSGFIDCPALHLTGTSKSLRVSDLPGERAFVDAKVDVTSIDELRHLQDLGFRVVDTNIQLGRKAEPLLSSTDKCRFAVLEDARWVHDIATNSFSVSRFHLDSKISQETADRIKAEWASNYFRNSRGDWMVVAEDETGIAGFLLLIKDGSNTILIDLIAVAEESRNQGLGRAMIGFGSQRCLGSPAEVRVGTQVANVRSLNFYLSLGFVITSVTYVLHLHTGASK